MSKQPRVLITGVAGFLGSSLAAKLLSRGASVVGLDNLSNGDRARVASLSKPGSRFEMIEGDIRDRALVKKALQGVDQLVHFAEMKIPRYGSSMETLEVNFEGTENLLAAASESKARFVFGSSDEVYGKNPEELLNEESSLVLGQTNVNRYSYATSKLMAEQLCYAFHERHKLPITILRYSGGYGPGQALNWLGGPQAVFTDAALKQDTMHIHGDGLQTRTFTYVDDLIEGTLLAMESGAADGEVFNIAGKEQISIINLAYLIWRLAGNNTKPKLEFVPYTDFSRNYEDIRHRHVDVSKAYYLLGFEAKTRLEQGLEKTIRWRQVEMARGGRV